MTRWRYTFEPDGIGTKVTESYEVAFTPPLLNTPMKLFGALPVTGALVRKRQARVDAGITTTLERLKTAAEDAEGP